jgi:squalene-hopene/tetraprenyl-beta-curcumene cyclase
MRSFPVPHRLAALCFAGLVFSLSPTARSAAPLGVQDNGSLGVETDLSVKRAVEWLCAQQKPEGFWSDADHPALTALALLAIQRSHAEPSQRWTKNIEAGYAFLRSQIRSDGGIYKSGLSNYNTSLALLAFVAKGDPRDVQAIRGAREFLVQLQAREMIRPELNGGIGYGSTAVSPKRQHPDLDNTLVALEALRASESVHPADETNVGRAKLDWDAAVQFISRCQNLQQPDVSSSPGARGAAAVGTVAAVPARPSVAPSERGGFVYYPGFSNAGETTDAEGNKALRSSGTMSYAGLLSFIYAEIPKEDARIAAALEWLRSHYTLKENPGLGTQGLFYYYHLMAKALSAAGVDRLKDASGEHAWKRELALELINRQEKEGFWINQTGRWMEKDPVLVTAYALLTLDRVREAR